MLSLHYSWLLLGKAAYYKLYYWNWTPFFIQYSTSVWSYYLFVDYLIDQQSISMEGNNLLGRYALVKPPCMKWKGVNVEKPLPILILLPCIYGYYMNVRTQIRERIILFSFWFRERFVLALWHYVANNWFTNIIWF